MQLLRHADLAKDFRALRRFGAPEESLAAWERLFCLKGLKETPAIDAFPGFGTRKIFKARVVPLRENVGKSKGYRAVFEMCADGSCVVLAFSRHGIYHGEADLFRLVKERLRV